MMEKLLGKNWITKLGGFIALIGGCMAALPKSLELDPQWAIFVASTGAAIAGFGAKDFNVHSTDREVEKATVQEDIKKVEELRGEG